MYADIIFAPCTTTYSGNYDRSSLEQCLHLQQTLRSVNHLRMMLRDIEDARISHKTDTTWPAAETTVTQNRYERYPDGTTIARVAQHLTNSSLILKDNRSKNIVEPNTIVVCSCGRHLHLSSISSLEEFKEACALPPGNLSGYRRFYNAIMTLVPSLHKNPRSIARARWWALWCCVAKFTAFRMFTNFQGFRFAQFDFARAVWAIQPIIAQAVVASTPDNNPCDIARLQQSFQASHGYFVKQNPRKSSSSDTDTTSTAPAFAYNTSSRKTHRRLGKPPRGGTHPLEQLFDFLFFIVRNPHGTVNQFLNNVGVFEDPEIDAGVSGVQTFVGPPLCNINIEQCFVSGCMSIEEWRNWSKVRLLEFARYYEIIGAPRMNKFIAQERIKKIKKKQAEFLLQPEKTLLDQAMAACFDSRIEYYTSSYSEQNTLVPFKTVNQTLPIVMLSIMDCMLSPDVILGAHHAPAAKIWRCREAGHERLVFANKKAVVNHYAFWHNVNLLDDPETELGTPDASNDTSITEEDLEDAVKFNNELDCAAEYDLE